MILFSIIWFTLIGLEIWRNYYIIEVKKERPNYLQSFIFRGFVGILYGIVVDMTLGYFPVDLWRYSAWGLFKIVWPLWFFQFSTFLTLFNLGLNLSRKKEFDYLGEHSGILDQTVTKISGRWAEKVYFIGSWLLAIWATIIFLTTGPR